MPFPNFVIIGPPKTGTTSIFNWLSEHPEVHTSIVKETYFFYPIDEHIKGPQTFTEEDFNNYKKLFKGYNGQKIICEATPGYIYSKSALDALKVVNPEMKLLFVYRKPAARLFSEYQFHCYKTKKTKKTLKEYTHYEQGSFSGAEVEQGYYGIFINNWIKTFGESQMIFMRFDDLKNDPQKFMFSLCHKLGIDEQPFLKFNFGLKNKTVKIRNRKLHELLLKLINVLPKYIINSLSPIYYKLNSKNVPAKTDEDQRIMTELETHYEKYDEEFLNKYGGLFS